MKYFLFLCFLLTLFSCSDLSKHDKSSGIDGCIMEIPPHILAAQQVERLNSVLRNPIDLVDYKKKYGPANSGTGKDKAFYNLPDTIGFTYEYMLFNGLTREISPKPKPRDLFHNFRINTYVFGNQVPNYSDTNEVLLEIACSMNNPTLKRVNVYGMSRETVIFQFNHPQFELENHFIYQDSLNNTFCIHFKKNKADWYKYIKLNPSFDLNTDIPTILTTF